MRREVCVSRAAQRDLREAVEYIEDVLKNPQATAELLEEVDVRLTALSEFAERHAVVDDPALGAWGIRLLRVGNYLAFYTIDGARVNVVRFLYARRDWLGLLRLDRAPDGEESQ